MSFSVKLIIGPDKTFYHKIEVPTHSLQFNFAGEIRMYLTNTSYDQSLWSTLSDKSDNTFFAS